MAAVLELRGVGKSYGWWRPRPALHEVWLRVEQGECFGLAGPNGAGKTSLIRLVLGLAMPDVGEVRLFGQRPEDPELRRRVGFVPEAAELSPAATPRQLVRRWAVLRGLSAAAQAQGLGCLERLGVGALVDRPVGKFSKGEKQRTLLALALLGEPELLVLDEPTDGLDPLGRALVRQVVREETAAGRTIFLNSHLLSETEKMCSRVGLLHRGRLERVQVIARVDDAGAGTSVVLVQQPPEAAALAAAQARPAPDDLKAPGATALLVDHRSLVQLNQSLDALRAAGALLVEVRRTKADLEAALVEVASAPDREAPIAGLEAVEAAPRPAWASEPAAPTPRVPLRPWRALVAMSRVTRETVAELAAQKVGWMLAALALLSMGVLVRVLQSDFVQSATKVTREALGQLDTLQAAQVTGVVVSTCAQTLFWVLVVLLTLMSSLFAVPLLDPRRTVVLFAQPISRVDHALGLFFGVVTLAGLTGALYGLATVGVLQWFGLAAPARLALFAVPLVVAFAPLYAVVLLATYTQRSGLFAALGGLGLFGLCLAVGSSDAVTARGATPSALQVLYAPLPKLLELGRVASRLAEGSPVAWAPVWSTAFIGLALLLALVVLSSRRES